MSRQFPRPPRRVTDEENRRIALRETDEEDREALARMYVEFDPADRAQGIPPSGESAVREWLTAISGPGTCSVVAVHGGDLPQRRVVGHAVLVPDGTAAELAIFVLQAYQSAGIGSQLLVTLLGLGQARGVDRVWLTVERWNDAAVALYESVGFDRDRDNGLELEMSRRL